MKYGEIIAPGVPLRPRILAKSTGDLLRQVANTHIAWEAFRQSLRSYSHPQTTYFVARTIARYSEDCYQADKGSSREETQPVAGVKTK